MKTYVAIALLCLVALPLAAASKTFDNATRLAALLQDTQGKATLTPAAWKTISGEAMVLANRIATSKAGREARKHVREMRGAAINGDAVAAKSHAALALPYVYEVIDASAPKGMAHTHM